MGADIIINVTVGIVSRGNEPFLEECLRALTAQGLDGLEVIVADISDEGGREKWLKHRLGKKQKCLYRHLPRCAAGAAKNYLLETAAGEYVAFIGEDICYLPGGLEKLYAQAKESGADMVIGRAAAGNFGGKEYPAAWTVDDVLKLGEKAYTAEELGERALLLCKSWSGDKLFRTAYLRENGLRFSEGAFPSAGVVFGVLACGKTAVSREAVLRTQDEDCVKYRKNPMKSATDVYLAMLSAEEALKRSGKAEALKKSFLTWCIEFAVWAYQKSGEKKRETREIIREKIEPWLKITEHGVSDYLTRKRFFKYCELCSEDDESTLERRFKLFDRSKRLVSIWGCCISREFLNLDTENFGVNAYLWHVPPNVYYKNESLPVSVRKVPYTILEQVEAPGTSIRSAYLNFNKLVLFYLKTHPADYLVVDIGDLRFDAYRIVFREDGVKTIIGQVERVMKFMDACLEDGYTAGVDDKIYPWFMNGKHIFSDEEWEQLLARYAADLKRLYPSNRIILNVARNVSQYVDGGKLYKFEKKEPCENMNGLFEHVETVLRQKLEGCHVIPVPRYAYADKNHRLGLHTLHYCKTAEEYRLEALKKIVFGHASNEEIQRLCDEYDKKLQGELALLAHAD